MLVYSVIRMGDITSILLKFLRGTNLTYCFRLPVDWGITILILILWIKDSTSKYAKLNYIFSNGEVISSVDNRISEFTMKLSRSALNFCI